MRIAIRDFLDPNHIVERSASMPLSKLFITKKSNVLDDYFDEVEWNRKKHVNNSTKAKVKKTDVNDWWTSSNYKGRDYSYTKISDSDFAWKILEEKNKKTKKDKNKFSTSSTWGLFEEFP